MITVYRHENNFLWIKVHEAWKNSFMEKSKIFCYVETIEDYEMLEYTANVAGNYFQLQEIIRLFSATKKNLEQKIVDEIDDDKRNKLEIRLADHLSKSVYMLGMLDAMADLKLQDTPDSPIKIIKKP